MSHYIRPHVGMGNHGNLSELRKNLAWWQKKDESWNPRRDKRIVALTQQINQLEQESL